MVNVLVVDDDKDFLKIIQKIMAAAGYSVVTTTDAMGAIEYLSKEIFDLVLSDVNMPGGSGFDLIRTIRKNAETSNVAVAMLTGRRDKEDVNKGLQCGADDYIVKPIDPDLLLSKVESLLQKKPQNRAEISFAQSPVRLSAKWEISTEIVSVSEQGMVLWSAISSAPNSKFKVSSPLFEQVQIEAPNLRVLDCTSDGKNPNMFFTSVTFVGLTEGERQKLRFWVNSNLMSQNRDREMA